MHKKLDAFMQDARSLDADTFARRYPAAVLVLIGVDDRARRLPPESSITGSLVTTSLSDNLRKTACTSNPSLGDVTLAIDTVLDVEKRMGGDLGASISIGRLETNDIVLDWPLISRSHAYIARAGDTYQVVDAGATNGVTVDGVLVSRGVAMPLQEHSLLRLGPYDFLFLLARSLREFLIARSPAISLRR